MEDKIVKKHIDVIVENTFKTIIEVYRTQKENQKIGTNNNSSSSRIIFPLKRESKDNKEEFRISEQELRFVFVEEFNKYCSKNGMLIILWKRLQAKGMILVTRIIHVKLIIQMVNPQWLIFQSF